MSHAARRMDRDPTIEFDNVVVTDDLENCLWWAVDSNLTAVGLRNHRRIETAAGSSFKNFSHLGKQRTWAVAGGEVTSKKIFLGCCCDRRDGFKATGPWRGRS